MSRRAISINIPTTYSNAGFRAPATEPRTFEGNMVDIAMWSLKGKGEFDGEKLANFAVIMAATDEFIRQYPRAENPVRVSDEIFSRAVASLLTNGYITPFRTNGDGFSGVKQEVIAWALVTKTFPVEASSLNGYPVLKVGGFSVYVHESPDANRFRAHLRFFDRRLADYMEAANVWDVDLARLAIENGIDVELIKAVT